MNFKAWLENEIESSAPNNSTLGSTSDQTSKANQGSGCSSCCYDSLYPLIKRSKKKKKR